MLNNDMDILPVGYDNVVLQNRVVAIVAWGPKPIKRWIESLRENFKVVDATCGRKTRSVIITDADIVLLSALHPGTLAERLNSNG